MLMDDTVFTYDDLPWVSPFSVQVQLKRMADLLVAAMLLISDPFVLVAALLIWIEDRGPVFYAQQRSDGLEGHLLFINCAPWTVQPADAPARWTQPGDQRITLVGVVASCPV